MGWRFRKSFKLLPGVRINVSKSGISTTIGASPLSLNVGPRGTQGNFSILGTGISYREKINDWDQDTLTPKQSPGPEGKRRPIPQSADIGFGNEEIRSASTQELSSEGLTGLRDLLSEALGEQRLIDNESLIAAREVYRTSVAFDSWNKGFLYKRIRKARFTQLGEDAREAKANLEELQEQRALTRIATQMDVAPEIRSSFGRLCDVFSSLATSQYIWDTLSTRRANRFVDRTIASTGVERKPVRFRLAQGDILQCEWSVPHLENANGGDLFIYPGFLLYRITREAFAVIDCREVTLRFSPIGFLEDEVTPTDSEHVGQTWKYANKDGSPDRRFSSNYPISIFRYGEIELTSFTGLNERYLVSNSPRAEEFVRAWQEFQDSLSLRSTTTTGQRTSVLPLIVPPEYNDDEAVERGAAIVAEEVRRQELGGLRGKKRSTEKGALILIGLLILVAIWFVYAFLEGPKGTTSPSVSASPSPSVTVSPPPTRRRRRS